jgi:hypothetical protein
MFVGKARSQPSIGAPEKFFTPGRCFSELGFGPTPKHQTRLERLARDKRSSLLRKFVNYDRKRFYNVDTWLFNKLLVQGVEPAGGEV